MNPALNNAVFRVTRRTRSGDDFGTPIYTESEFDVPGFFDESLAAMRAARSNRDGIVPTSLRRAVFFTAVGADLKERDEGEVLVGGISVGRWSVEKDEIVPIPGGASHREWAMERVAETR